ncbi:MAG: 8-amino-7-oxononanoate synthase [Proteobacteria bacterium]|nr:8-amino-7-oxononanoate synthase [Pseudomonadota bacterium]
MDFDSWVRADLTALQEAALLRTPRELASPQQPEVCIDGRQVLCLCSNNYLGLATHPELARALAAGAREHGSGAGASRLVSGTLAPHRAAESALAAFVGTQDALLYASGYAANVGTLAALLGPDDIVLSDALNHASLIDGCRLSSAQIRIYRHLDMQHLEALLRAHRAEHARALIVSEALFSMDGDCPDLPRLHHLARDYDAALLIDEAHSIGVLGPQGRGLCAAHALHPDILIGTLGKALGLAGAFAAGTHELRKLLQTRARSFVYSTAPLPALAAAIPSALQLALRAEHPRQRLLDNAALLRRQLRSAGYRVPEGSTPIIPVLVGEPARALELSERLFASGVFVQAIRPPTVPAGTSRLRLVPMASHTPEQLARALDAFQQLAAEPSFSAHPPGPQEPSDDNAAAVELPTKAGPRLAYFVTGTGTGIGKTYVTRGLARAMRRTGLRVAALKPIETGCDPAPRDAEALALACQRLELAQAPDLYRARLALCPHAVTLETAQAPPDIPALASSVRRFASNADVALAEGAGGLFAPLDAHKCVADLAAELRWPLLLVAPDGLGVLSHVLSAASASRRHGLELSALVLTSHLARPNDPSLETNGRILFKRLAVPVFHFPHARDDDDALAHAAEQSGLVDFVSQPLTHLAHER